jgi:hypothetical protein
MAKRKRQPPRFGLARGPLYEQLAVTPRMRREQLALEEQAKLDAQVRGQTMQGSFQWVSKAMRRQREERRYARLVHIPAFQEAPDYERRMPDNRVSRILTCSKYHEKPAEFPPWFGA